MTKLSTRIRTIVDLVNDDAELVWDICCDHGHIGKALLPKYSVHFVDQIPSIIKKLALNLKQDADIPSDKKYKLFTQDAKKQDYQSSKRSCFIIAGIGGVLSIEILKQILLHLKEQDTIILSVHKNILEVRNFLKETPLKLHSEVIIKDNKQFYEIMLLSLRQGNAISHIGGPMWLKNDEVCNEYLKEKIKYYQTKAKHDTCWNNIVDEYLHLMSYLKKENDSY